MTNKSIISCGLLADGNFDIALIPILKWLLHEISPDLVIKEFEPIDLSCSGLRSTKLQDRIKKAIEIAPCDLLFIHRDAEKMPIKIRISEIISEWDNAQISEIQYYVPVVPIRMTEAWLLLDEAAIKKAAGNRNSKVKLELPAVKKLEDLIDPKAILYDLLKSASELKGRNLQKFSPAKAAKLVAEYTEDFAPLLNLSAFQQLKTTLEETLQTLT